MEIFLAPNHQHRVKLLKFLLPLLGYKQEPITTLTLIYRHNRGTRIGITQTTIWYNK